MVVFNSADGSQAADRSLGDTAVWSDGLSLGRIRSGREVFATLVDRTGTSTAIIRLNLEDYSVHQTTVIADSPAYPHLVVGPSTGRLFLASLTGFRIAVLDPRNPKRVLRYSSSRDPSVYQSVMWFDITPNERRLFVSYHGAATGVDWLDLNSLGAVACNEYIAQPPRIGCASAHGRVTPYRGGLVAATGRKLVLINENGFDYASFETGLGPTHFMEFAVDTVSRTAYGISECGGGGGIGRIFLEPPTDRPTSNRVMAPTVCGSRVVHSEDGQLLAVASNSQISLVDAQTGTVLRTITAPGRVIDLLLVR